MGKKYSVYIRDRDKDLIDWLEKRLKDGTFHNPSHAFVKGLRKLKEEEEAKKEGINI